MARKIKPEISDDQFKAVIEYLEQPKSTKKVACEMIGIAYNTTRLGALIQEWLDDQERDARLRKEKRKQACTHSELVSMIEDYLDGSSFEELSNRHYRSTAYIRHKLELAGALIRVQGTKNPLYPPMLPDECVLLEEDFRCCEHVAMEVANEAEYEKEKKRILAEKGWEPSNLREVYSRSGKFDTHRAIENKGELVWLPGYQCLGEVCKEVPSKEGKAYRVYLLDQGSHQYVNVRSWDMGSLRHLVELGVDVSRMGSFMNGTECKSLLNKALEAARKGKNKDK